MDALLSMQGVLAAPAGGAYAYRFNGTDEYFTRSGGLPALGNYPFTYWIRFKWDGNGGATQYLVNRNDGGDYWSMYLTSGTATITANFGTAFFTAGRNCQIDTVISANTWYDLLVECRKNASESKMEIQVWKDGVDLGAATCTTAALSGANIADLKLAVYITTLQFSGDIAQFAVWDGAYGSTANAEDLLDGTKVPTDIANNELWWKADPNADDLASAGGVIDNGTLGTADGTATNMTTAANIVAVT